MWDDGWWNLIQTLVYPLGEWKCKEIIIFLLCFGTSDLRIVWSALREWSRQSLTQAAHRASPAQHQPRNNLKSRNPVIMTTMSGRMEAGSLKRLIAMIWCDMVADPWPCWTEIPGQAGEASWKKHPLVLITTVVFHVLLEKTEADFPLHCSSSHNLDGECKDRSLPVFEESIPNLTFRSLLPSRAIRRAYVPLWL